MRYRRIDADGDMTFGGGAANFLVDSPEAVAQAVLTRLRLMSGEWFFDSAEGTPYATEILGERTRSTYDLAIQERILGTEGVTSIATYSSSMDGRALTVEATIDTEYGAATLSAKGLAPPFS